MRNGSNRNWWTQSALGLALGAGGAIAGGVVAGVLVLVLGLFGPRDGEWPLVGVSVMVAAGTVAVSILPAALVGAALAVTLLEVTRRTSARAVWAWLLGASGGLLAGLLVLALINTFWLAGLEGVLLEEATPFLVIGGLVGALIGRIMLWLTVNDCMLRGEVGGRKANNG